MRLHGKKRRNSSLGTRNPVAFPKSSLVSGLAAFSVSPPSLSLSLQLSPRLVLHDETTIANHDPRRM